MFAARCSIATAGRAANIGTPRSSASSRSGTTVIASIESSRGHDAIARTGSIEPTAINAPRVPSHPTSTDAITDPAPTVAKTIASSAPNARPMTLLGMSRCSNVNPETSRIAFPSPGIPSRSSAVKGCGIAASSAIGAPHKISPRAYGPASRRRPMSDSEATAPAIPPTPKAELSQPTPASPMASSSIDATTMSTLSAPRTVVCAPNST